MTEKIPKQKHVEPESDKYRPLNVLGTGGMKVVVKAEDISACRNVAMAISKNSTERNNARFLEEARITASLEHPNIVPVHEVGLTKTGSPFFTMKIVQGYTLEEIFDKLREGDPEFLRIYTLRFLLDIFLKICDAIAFAHSKEIIHLDLKPSNIQVGGFGEVLVLDWGIARRLFDETEPDDFTVSAGMICKSADTTLDGVVKGTPEYMAPEQAAGRNSERCIQTDIYALGAILYTILTWNKPFNGEDATEIITNVLEGNFLPPHKAAWSDKCKIPQALEFVVYKAMERNSSKRYQSVASLKADVQAYLNGYATEAEEAGFFTNALLWLKRKKVQVYVFFSIFLLVLITVGFLGMHFHFQARSRDVYGSVVKARQAAEETIAGLQARIRNESLSEWTLKFEDTFADAYLYERWGFFFGEGSFLSMTQAQQFAKYRKGAGLRIFSGPARLQMVFRENMRGGEIRMVLEASWNKSGQHDALVAGLNCESLGQGYIFVIQPGKDAYIAIMRGRNQDLLAEQPIDLPVGTVGKFDMIMIPGNNGTTLKMSFNGRELISLRDMENHARVSKNVVPCILSFANSDVTLRSVKLMSLGLPLKADLLDIADRQLRKGNYEAACQLYREAEESSSHAGRRQHAAQGLRQAEMMLQFRDKLPEWRKLLEKAWPDAEIALNIGQTGFALQASGRSVGDLSVLSDMPLSSLVLKDTGVLKLSPLKKMKMNHLALIRCEVEDLPSLANLNLSELVLHTIPLSTLPDLNMPDLKSLTVSNCALKSVESLRSLSLEYLDLSGNLLTDLSPVAGMPVSDLNVSANRLTSIASLRNMPLTRLNIASNRVVLLEPLRGKNLNFLAAAHNSISDISALAGMPLEELDLSFNSISSLQPLEKVTRLRTLKLVYNKIRLLDSLAGLGALTRLQVDFNAVKSLSPLLRCTNLRTLTFSHNQVESLSPLRNLNFLRSLNCSFNPVLDADPIAHLKLNRLYVYNTRVTSFRALFEHPPKHFIFGNDATSLSEWERVEKTIAELKKPSPELLRSVRILIAYRKRDAASLRALATDMNGLRCVIVPILSDYRNARKDAFYFKALFPSWSTPLERNALIRMIDSAFWIEVQKEGDSLVWTHGKKELRRYVSGLQEIPYGCIFMPTPFSDNFLLNRYSDLRLPLVLVWH